MSTRRWLSVLAILLSLALVATACGSDDDGGGSESADAPADDGGDAPADDGGDAPADEPADDGGDDGGDTVELTGEGGRLAAVRDRGNVICGGNDTLPGFGIVDETGEFSGFDIDFCKVVAAGVLGDANAFEIVPLAAEARFLALSGGEVDVLIRNTTWTATRDGQEGANFLHTTFFDGQGMMVPASTGFTALEDLADANICVLSGTTTELNLTAVFGALGIPFNPVVYEDNTTLRPAYEEGQCEAWTSDASQLAAFKSAIEGDGGEEQFLFQKADGSGAPLVISKEPLGPVVADGDTEWAQAVNWSVMATIQAWEFGLDSGNIASYAGDDPNILNFLGQDDFDPGLGLAPDFAIQVVSQVGNYEEIYNRTVGQIDPSLALPGSVNDLWTNGGLQYVPPYR